MHATLHAPSQASPSATPSLPQPDARRRLRVLIIAEMCNPEMISVPLVGWSHARAIAQVTDALIVTQVRNRAALLRAGWVEGKQFVCIDTEAMSRFMLRVGSLINGKSGAGWTTGMALYLPTYWVFETLIWRMLGARIAAGEFDVVHRLTPLSPTIPSLVASRCKDLGVPFVIGPLNGGLPWPKAFDSARRKEREWLSYIRDAYKLFPGYRSTRRNASAILIASQNTWQQMAPEFHRHCFYIPENAIDPSRFFLRRTHTATRPIKAVFIGRLVPYKGADMLVEAAAPLVTEGAMTVEILGDGPQMAPLREKVLRLGLVDGIHLPGWVEHTEIQRWLSQADVLAFPSVREFGGGVVLEAMAAGVVPIVMDYGGPAELVTPGTGFTIPMGNRAQIIERLRAVLTRLAADPLLIDARSPAAARRVRETFTWQYKAQRVLDVYHWVVDPDAPRPNYAMPWPDPVVSEGRT